MRVFLSCKALTNRWVLLSIAVWSVVALLGVAIIMMISRTNDLRQAAGVLEQDIRVLTDTRDRIEQEKIHVGFDDKKISEILTELLSSSKRAGVHLGETKLGDTDSRGTYVVIPISVSVKGNYNQIGMFVNILEDNLRFKITDISLSTKDTRGPGIVAKLQAEYVIL